MVNLNIFCIKIPNLLRNKLSDFVLGFVRGYGWVHKINVGLFKEDSIKVCSNPDFSGFIGFVDTVFSSVLINSTV